MRVSITGTHLCAVALALLLAGCASNGNNVEDIHSDILNDDEQRTDAEIEGNEQALYEAAQADLENGRYSSAVEKLETLDARYPFGDRAEQTQLDLIYAYYQINNWEATRAAASRFIRLQPDHPEVDYAYYMRGLAAYQAGRFSLERLRLIDISKRDLGATRDAYSDFRELIERFPDSEYAPDARQRIVYLRNVMAAKELHVADFYLRKGAYVAAVERGRWVVEHYPESTETRNALAVMVEGYLGLDMRDRAREVLETLIENDPDNERLRGNTFRPQYVDAAPISA